MPTASNASAEFAPPPISALGRALPNVIAFPDKGLGYGITAEQLAAHMSQFNPIDNLAPLAANGVKILHVHGGKDELVPTDANSFELARRYKQLGGSARIVVIPGLGHGGTPLYESKPLIEFLADKSTKHE